MFPFRQPSDSDLRPDPRRYGSGAERDFFRPPQESLSPGPAPQDGVLSLLSSCGLEPEDLSVLAKLPEDILTVESLPQILKQIKGQKAPGPGYPPRPEEPFHLGTSKPLPARPSSPPPPSSSFKAFGPAPRDWERLRRQPDQYPLHLLSSDSRPDRWQGQQASGSGRSPPRRAVDQDLRPRPPVYGKDGSSFIGSAGRTRPSRFSGSGDFRTAPPLEERRRDSRSSFSGCVLPRVPDRDPDRILNRGRDPASGAMPSKKQALDFHGTLPPAFPYSCSLCDIAVLSEKVWIQHVNTTGHADGQLNLLQRFPRWDCRLETAGRDENQSNQRRDGGNPALPPPRPNQNRAGPQTSKKQQKASDKGKVVCAKFPPQAVDEASLRKLIEPFGKVGKILMFPSLAFVEMGSSDQAKDLVKFYSSSDPEAKKVKVEFSISNAFSFLQSSQVVSFTPAPSGEDGRSDLLSIAKRFGEPLFTLFLPSKAFVEMKLSAEAQKLVDYYSANSLRLNGATIQVAFSSEYRTLLRVPSAQKYEEEPAKTKEPNRTRLSRTRSRSRERSTGQQQRRSGSGDRKRPENRTRTRSRSRERSRGRQRRRSGSGDRKRPETRTRTRSRSRERHGISSPGQNQNQTEGKPKEPQNPESRSASEPQRDEGGDDDDDEAQPVAEEEEKQLGDEDQSDSDIEGMEVIAEDGQNLDEEDEEDEEEPEPPAGKVLWREKLKSGNDFPDGEEPEKTGAEEEEEEVEFPVDLESCITLDEVKTDDEDEAPPADGRCKEDGKTGSGEPGPEPIGPTKDNEGSGSVSKTQEEPEPDRSGPEPETQTRSRKSSGDDGTRTAPEPGPEKRKAIPENDDVPLKTLRSENGPEPDQNRSTAEPEADEEKKQQIQSDEQNPAEPEPREQESAAPPAEGATEPQKPVGAEFVRPVVGYFCNLCQLIFIDEDEAKLQHCATPAHHRKYQEKTGNDPRTS